MKLFRRILFYVALTCGVLIIAIGASVFLYKDRIIHQFVEEANKHLNTRVSIKRMDVSWTEQFPRISVVFHDVYVEDSHEGQYPLMTAEKVSFALDLLALWKGDYRVTGMEVHEAEVELKINKEGENNYTVTRKKEGETSGGTGGGFAITDVAIRNARVHYVDMRVPQDFMFVTDKLNASIHADRDVYEILAKGNVLTEKLTIGTQNYIDGKTFAVTSHLLYDDNAKSLTIQPSELKLNDSRFDVSGTYAWSDESVVSLKAAGKNTDVQTLISLLPERHAHNLAQYRSKGDVYFSAKLDGELSRSKSPALSVDFGFEQATLYHPRYKTRIEQANLNGSFRTSDVERLKNSELALRNVKGRLNGKSFEANFVLKNFSDPDIDLSFRGEIDAPAVFDFYPVKEVHYVSGTLDADITFKGRLKLLQDKATAQRVITRGAINLHGINLLFGRNRIPFEGLRGNLQFNNNDLALSNVTGKLGHSDFVLNGFFKNVITFLLFEGQPIGIETDLRSNFVDLNELLAFGFGELKDDKAEARDVRDYTFSVSDKVNLNFNCDISSLHYRRFRGQAIRGDLLVKNQMAVSRSLSMRTMGGGLTLSGILDARNNKAIDITSSLKLNGLHLDSVFYVFENFNQTFIQDRHLKGRTTADVNLEFTLNERLHLFQETLRADIGISIAQGQLNNFEPLRKLERYLGDEGLDRLRFSELQNDIRIENKKIHIPQMEVRSNVTNIKISGTHTFDQLIDYRIVTPLRPKRVIEADADGAWDRDSQGNSRLFLKIVGTTDNYRVAYDTEAVKKKIVDDIKREVVEIKDAFKPKSKREEKELELSEDDYFDW